MKRQPIDKVLVIIIQVTGAFLMAARHLNILNHVVVLCFNGVAPRTHRFLQFVFLCDAHNF
jgi:hypothetical protein